MIVACVALLILVGALIVSQMGIGNTVRGATTAELGDMTTEAGVVGALESTGYEIRYRKVPRVEGYENVSGEAIDGDNRVQFTVEIRLAGPYEEIKKRSELNPQPPVLRYGRGLEGGDVVGNVAYHTQQQAPAYAGRGFELATSKAQAKMNIHIGVALRGLFAPEIRPVG